MFSFIDAKELFHCKDVERVLYILLKETVTFK